MENNHDAQLQETEAIVVIVDAANLAGIRFVQIIGGPAWAYAHIVEEGAVDDDVVYLRNVLFL